MKIFFKLLSWRILVVVGAGLSVVGLFTFGKSPSVSYLDLRYIGVIEQSNEYTCGAAAVATLLTYFYGVSTSESDVLNLVYEAMRARGEKPSQEQGLTAYDLKEALKAKGITSKGFLVKPAALQDYFSRGGLPVIIHLTKPEKHFEVAVGMIGDQIVIADPSWGRSIIPLSELVKQRGYDGVVLVPIQLCPSGCRLQAENSIEDKMQPDKALRLSAVCSGISLVPSLVTSTEWITTTSNVTVLCKTT